MIPELGPVVTASPPASYHISTHSATCFLRHAGKIDFLRNRKAAACSGCGYLFMVPKAGLEPARVAPLPPQDSVSTKFHHFGTKPDRVFTIILFWFVSPLFRPEAVLAERSVRFAPQWGPVFRTSPNSWSHDLIYKQATKK